MTDETFWRWVLYLIMGGVVLLALLGFCTTPN